MTYFTLQGFQRDSHGVTLVITHPGSARVPKHDCLALSALMTALPFRDRSELSLLDPIFAITKYLFYIGGLELY